MVVVVVVVVVACGFDFLRVAQTRKLNKIH